MSQTRGQDFDWSDCRLIDLRNLPFLKSESDLIAGEFERKVTLVFMPTCWAGVAGALLYRAPDWFTALVMSLVWITAFCMGLEGNRILAGKTCSATLLKGEVSMVTLPDTLEYGGSKVFVRFVTPDQQTIEVHADSQRQPDQWQIGDKVVVLFADNDSFWIL